MQIEEKIKQMTDQELNQRANQIRVYQKNQNPRMVV